MSQTTHALNYIVITPVRNEGAHFSRTIDAMVAQTVRPLQWVIVDDGSTDETGALADRAARTHSWIRVIHRSDRGCRKPGGGVIEAFYDGYQTINDPPTGVGSCSDWGFLAKLDGDLTFAPDYFEKCLARFRADPALGIGGGRVHCEINGTLADDSPNDPPFHVRGATKIYRRATWEAIGGLLPAPGWDTLDELKANMLGWKSRSFLELQVHQLKATGAADGVWKDSFKNGRANYVAGYHPVFMLAKCVKRVFAPPYFIGAAGLACGFLNGYLDRQVRRVNDAALIRYVRAQQLRKLTFRPSIWD